MNNTLELPEGVVEVLRSETPDALAGWAAIGTALVSGVATVAWKYVKQRWFTPSA